LAKLTVHKQAWVSAFFLHFIEAQTCAVLLDPTAKSVYINMEACRNACT